MKKAILIVIISLLVFTIVKFSEPHLKSITEHSNSTNIVETTEVETDEQSLLLIPEELETDSNYLNESTDTLQQEEITCSIIVEDKDAIDEDCYLIAEGARAFKSYMDYRCITNTRSKAYQVAKSATVLSNGLLVVDDEYYCVAMGTYYGEVGDRFYIETDEGNSWKVIICDTKSDKHTDSTHRYTLENGCMLEFVVDTRLMPKNNRLSGTVNGLGFSGKITLVKKIG